MAALEAETIEDSCASPIQAQSADRAETGAAAMTAEPGCPAGGCRSVAAEIATTGMELPLSGVTHIANDRAFAHRK